MPVVLVATYSCKGHEDLGCRVEKQIYAVEKNADIPHPSTGPIATCSLDNEDLMNTTHFRLIPETLQFSLNGQRTEARQVFQELVTSHVLYARNLVLGKFIQA